MITTQQIIDRLREISNDKKLLKQFNNDNFTDITDIYFDIGNNYTCVIIYTKHFTFDAELYDYHNKCNYSLSLRETAWSYDFDDCTDKENISYMFTNDGEFSESSSPENIDEYLAEMLPSKYETRELESRIKSLLKFKEKIKEIVDEHEGNQYFVVDFMKRYCDCF